MSPGRHRLALILIGVPIISGTTIALLGGATAIGLWARRNGSPATETSIAVARRIPPSMSVAGVGTTRANGLSEDRAEAFLGNAVDDAVNELWASFARVATLPVAERLVRLCPDDPRLQTAISSDHVTTGARIFLLRALAARDRDAATGAAQSVLENQGRDDEGLRSALLTFLETSLPIDPADESSTDAIDSHTSKRLPDEPREHSNAASGASNASSSPQERTSP